MLDKQSISVFFACSEQYAQHFTVAAVSLLINNNDVDVEIYVIHEASDVRVLNSAANFLMDTYKTTVTLLPIGELDATYFTSNEYYGKYTFFRLVLAKVAPKTLETALFLDVDLVVTGSLKQLININLSNYALAAVSEVEVIGNVSRLNSLGENLKGYFNAGVLLVNLNWWRKNDCFNTFLQIAHQYEGKLVWADQDIMNICFADSWLPLDSKYNAIHVLKTRSELPVIVHYNTFSKPWHYVDTHPYNYLYQHYLALTPFANANLENFSLKNFILKNGRLFKRLLRNKNLIK